MQRNRRQQAYQLAGSARVTEYLSAQPPSIVALLAQITAGVTAAGLALAISASLNVESTLITWMGLQCVTSAFLAYRLRLSLPWILICLAFVPALALGMKFHISPNWYLGLLVMLIAIYWNTFRTQVPLYLSSSKVKQAVVSLLPPDRFTFIDIGCGVGSLVNHLSNTRADGKYWGVEIAPLPFLVAYARSLFAGRRSVIRRANLWRMDLSRYDVVYAYLSPVPMPALWEKVRKEMRSGTIFISNSFAIPGVRPDYTLSIEDATHSVLYVWHMRGGIDEASRGHHRRIG